jgi:hypothetical protein
MRCFVNERPVELTPGASVLDAVRAFDTDLVSQGVLDLRITDGRGLPVSPDDVLAGGSILRVSRSARTTGHADP